MQPGDNLAGAETNDRQPLLKPTSQNRKKEQYGTLPSALRDDFKKSTTKRPEKRDDFGRIGLLSFATCLDYWLIAIGSLSSIIHGAGFPLLSVVLGGMTNVFLRAQNSDFVVFDGGTIGANDSALETITRDEFKTEVQRYSIYYLVLGVLMLVTSYVQIACWETLAERLVHSIRRNYFRAILRQDIGWYDSMQTGNLTARLTDDLERVREGLGDKCSIFIQLVAAFVAGFGVGFFYSWQMTLVMLIFTPALAWTNAWMGRMMVRRTKMEQEQYAVAGAIADETFSSMRTVLALNGQHQELKRYEKALEDGRTLGVKKYLYMALGLGSNYIITYLSFAAAFMFASRLVIWYPDFDRGAIFTVFFAVMNGSTALGAALPNYSSMSSAKGALHYVLSVLNSRPKIDPYSDEGFQLNGRVRGAIQLNDVHFSYPLRKESKILNGVSFSVKAGQKLALVGSSGCGKSTIVNMILRFYDPDQGTVLLDGYDLRDLNVRSLRDAIGVVSQEPILFDGTLEENIMLGNEFATREDVNRCCKMANAYNFIHNLPDGLYTRVGERGVQLSGGQKQRIAIARALIRNPKILLLDEATSALDTESEKIVQEALDKAQEGRTTIIVAHRLATLRNVDEILVFHEGRIIERGTHDELYKKQGVFYEMVNAQQIEQNKDAKAALDTIFDDGEESSSSSDDEHETTTIDFAPSVSSLPREDRVGLLQKRSLSRGSRGNRAESVSLRRKRTTASISSLDSQHSQMVYLREMQEDMEKSKLKPSSISKIFKMNRDSWHFCLFGLIGCILSGAIVPVFALIYSQIFAVFSEPVDQLETDAIFWSAMFIVIGFLNALGFFISANMLGRCGEALTKKLRLEAFRNLMRQDIGFFDDERHNTGKLCTRFATDAPNVRYVFTRLPVVISSVVTLIGAILVGFLNGWKLALVLLLIVPFIVASGYFEMKLHFGKQMRNTELLEEAGKIASEAVENIRTVAGLNKQLIFHRKYCENLVQPFKTNLRQAQIYGTVFAFSQSLMFFMYALAFWIGSIFVLNGSMTPVAVYRVFFAIAFCGQSIGQLSSFIPDVVKAKVAASLLFHLIERPTEIDSLSDLGISKKISGNIELRNIHFSYPTRRKARVLNNLNLDIREGQTVALVGYSGCGKSTIISLLERFYNPKRGNIFVDGVGIADYNIHKLREQVCVVSQEPILFDATIAENICYGLAGASALRANDRISGASKSEHSGSEESGFEGSGELLGMQHHLGVSYEDIVAATTAANIHNFILGLPDGYQTRVGAKGTQLSGGQKQRIAIARALIRNPIVLLLDEATSALDSESERVVQEALDNAKKGRTCIVIAHRLSTVQNADQIAVINEGKVVQKGTHQELLAQEGIYQSLCQTQILRSVNVSEAAKE